MRKSMIYLEDAQYSAISKLASQGGKSMSALFREAVQLFLDARVKGGKKNSLKSLSALGQSRERNHDARDHDALLYGLDKSSKKGSR